MFTPTVIFQIILMFFVLVTIHEWGHYYFAKRAGILVREFAIGFGPKIFSYYRNETTYTLRLLPLGGYVRMAGEDPEIDQFNTGQTIAIQVKDDQVTHIYLDQLDQRRNTIIGEVLAFDIEKDLFVVLDVDGERQRFDVHDQALLVKRDRETQIAPLDRQFNSKTVGQRALAIFAGPLMNFILAFGLFILFIALNGVPEQLRLAGVEPNSPAESAQLQAGDLILSVNGEEISGDMTKFKEMISESSLSEMTWIIERGGQQIESKVTPKVVDGVGVVGISVEVQNRSASFVETFTGGWDALVSTTKMIFQSFKLLVTGNFTLDDLGGPVRIVEVTGEFAQAGLQYYVYWSAIFSLYLGIFNLLPIPALDGSRLIFIGIEAVRGKPVDPNRESMVHFIGFAMLMLLMLAVTYNDVLRLFKG